MIVLSRVVLVVINMINMKGKKKDKKNSNYFIFAINIGNIF